MSNREILLTPVGRLVQGSLYDPQTTDAEGRPLVVKTGVNQGQPRVEYYFALAIPKGSERHWSETDWGAIIHRVGIAGFPNGQATSKSFAWKIHDGDSTEVNKAGRRPCDREGYPRHWVLNFSSGFAPGIYNEDGSQILPEPNHAKPGDYIQVYGSVSDNGSAQQPGVFLNHQYVAFMGYGTRIILGVDPKAVGFGKSPKPSYVMSTPPDAGFSPAPITPPPYPQILVPPVGQTHVMTPKAKGATYDQMIAAGWTDDLLIQHGMMLP